MKTYVIILLAFAFQAAAFDVRLFGAVGCGNDSTAGPAGNTEPVEGDPVNVYTADEFRKIDDLTIWGGIGEHKLVWSRWSHTRTTSGARPFGAGHNWRHSYLWEMGDTSLPDAERAQVTIYYPEGASIMFTQDSPTEWRPTTACGDLLHQAGDDFYLQRANGWTFHFLRSVNGEGANVYKMMGFTDSRGTLYALTYNAQGRVATVNEPGGRGFIITYIGTGSRIRKVQTTDGRSVDYTYSNFTASNGTVYSNLTQAGYDDGTQALYEYQEIRANNRPLGTSFKDPRNRTAMAKSKTIYYSGTSEPLGAVLHQASFSSATPLSTIQIVGADVHKPSMSFASGGTNDFTMTYGLRARKVNTLGKVTKYSFASNGVGYIADLTDHEMRGYMTSTTDAEGRRTEYVRSEYGNPLQVTHPGGVTEAWTRDSLDLPLTYTDPRGGVTTYTRDVLHRPTRIDYPDSTYETFTYNAFGDVLSHRLRSGGTEVFTYDVRGLLTSKTDALSNSWLYTYDSLDRPATITDPNGNTTAFEYNSIGKLTEVTHPDGSTKLASYDEFGNKTSETDELGKVYNYSYDEFQRLVSSEDPLDRTTTLEYGANTMLDKPSAIITPSGNKTSFHYDTEWRVTSKTVGADSPDAATTSYTYDGVGNVTQVTDPLGQVTKYTYDVRNRVISLRNARSKTSTWTYDNAGNTLTFVKPNGATVTNTYDADNRLKTSTNPLGNTVEYTYDGGGNVVSFKDSRANIHAFEYNALNRNTKWTLPNGRYEEYAFDPVGNLISKTVQSGVVATMTYDNRNRQTEESWSDGVTLGSESTYDAVGRLLTLKNDDFELEYSYDDAGQMLSEKQKVVASGATRTVATSYNADGLRSTMTYPDTKAFIYTYTKRNQVKDITCNLLSAPLVSYVYDLAGRKVSRSLNNLTNTAYTYDPVGNLTEINFVNSVGSFENRKYAYNSVDDRTYQLRGIKGETFSYDLNSQITGVKYEARNASTTPINPASVVNFSFDAAGNRTTVDEDGVIKAYTANAENQYTTIDSDSPSYDDNGNQTSNNGWTLQYDGKNRLISASNGSHSISQSYDPRGRCMKRAVDGVTSYRVFENWNLIATYDAAGAEVAAVAHGNALGEVIFMWDAAFNLSYFHQDGLGNVIALTNLDGVIAEKYKYDIYGKPTILDPYGLTRSSSFFDNNLLFGGMEYVGSAEIYDCRYRFYSHKSGRFLSPDPLGLDSGENLYAYTLNNPVNRWDPLGLDWLHVDGKAKKATYYGGDLGDTSSPKAEYDDVASGKKGNTDYSDRNKGPTPPGDYKIDLEPDPERMAPRNPNGDLKAGDSGGIEQIPEDLFETWGNERAKLEPMPGTDTHNRDDMYIHDSGKGETSGCTEIPLKGREGVFDEMKKTRSNGQSQLPVRISY